MVGCLGMQVLRGVLTEPTLALAIEFAAFLQISRLFNRRTAVDYQQIAVLAFLHLIAATVLSTNLSYAALFVGFVDRHALDARALAPAPRDRGQLPGADRRRSRTRAVAIRRVLASRRVVGPRFLLGTALLSLPLFAMTLAIFVIIPRVGQGFLTFAAQPGPARGRLRQPGRARRLRRDPRRPDRGAARHAAAARSTRRRRASRCACAARRSIATTAGAGRARRAPRCACRASRPHSYRGAARAAIRDSDQQLQIVLDHLEEPVVFLPEGTVALSVPPRVVGAARTGGASLTTRAGLDMRYDATRRARA